MTTDEKIKAVAAVLTLGTLIWSAYSFLQLRAVEAAKPYLEKKLDWCEEAVTTAARIANADPMQPGDIEKFWQLYWGVMGLIERESVTKAMIAFGADLPRAASAAVGAPPQGLKEKSLALAHACREELSREWSPRWARQ